MINSKDIQGHKPLVKSANIGFLLFHHILTDPF